MSERYKTMRVEEARMVFPAWDYCDYGSVLLEFDNSGNPLRMVGWDGGEPEDQTFGRDWDWVVRELNAAVTKERACNVAQLRELAGRERAEADRFRDDNRHYIIADALDFAATRIEGGGDG